MAYAYQQLVPPYPYDPLGKGEIRLLQLVPGDPGPLGSIIYASLKHYDIQAPPSYIALSYVWGQEPPLHRIMIDNLTVFVRPNLFHALQRIRHREKPLLIWVDSLCINQLDDKERTDQVQQMAPIYQNAANVHIWLGEEDAMTKSAFEVVEEIHQDSFDWTDGWWDRFSIVSLGRLLHRTWFRRGWVIQEAAHARSSLLCCGIYQIQMDKFTKVVAGVRRRIRRVLRHASHPGGEFPSTQVADDFESSPGMRFINLIRDLESTEAGSESRLDVLVGKTAYSETTDQRDAIYALLSLASDVNASSSSPTTIVPDYGRKVLDVFADFFLHCCKATGSLDILVRPWAPLSPAPNISIGIGAEIDRLDESKNPTWIRSRHDFPCGDPARGWTHRLHADHLVWLAQLEPYSAHGKTNALVSVGVNDWGNYDGSLFARGVVLCRIEGMSSRMAEALISPECVQILEQRDSDGNGLSLIDQYSVLCANRQADGANVSERYLDAFDYLVGTGMFIGDSSSPPPFTTTRGSSIDIDERFNPDTLPEHVREYLQVVKRTVWNRRVFVGSVDSPLTTDKRRVRGLLPRSAHCDDLVCVLFGCSVPVVLREMNNAEGGAGACWQFIGEAYVHDYMDGQAFKEWSEDELKNPKAGLEFKIR